LSAKQKRLIQSREHMDPLYQRQCQFNQ